MLKIRKSFLVVFCFLLVGIGVTIFGKQIKESSKNANAASENITLQDYVKKYLHNQKIGSKKYIEPKAISSEKTRMALKSAGSVGSLPSRYNSREEDCGGENGCVSRVEDQMVDGLCWAYSYTTLVESFVLNTTGVKIELSPNQMDYLMVPGVLAYSDATSNPYYDFVESFAELNRELGGGGNAILSGYIGASKVGLVRDGAFWSRMQLNDASLLGYSSFTDFMETQESGYIYTGKMRSMDVLNEENSEYEVLASRDIIYLDYGDDADENLPSYTREKAILEIKNAILDYGAVEADSYFDIDNCMTFTADAGSIREDGTIKLSGLKDITVIDRGQGVCSEASGHAMVLVGWDDNWEYEDNGVTKNGAFIVQNSWGETMDVIPTYFAYDSDFDLHFATEVRSVADKPTDSHVYDLTDYKANTVSSGKSELIFTFEAESEREVIDDISFYQVLYYGDVNYDVFVSPTGSGADFVKVGTMNTPYPGWYVLHLNQMVEDNFLVKIVERSYPSEVGGFSTKEKSFDRITVYTHEDNTPVPVTYDYMLSFDANGGNGAPGNLTYSGTETSHEFTIPAGTPTRSGYNFLGWASSRTATIIEYAAGGKILLNSTAPSRTLFAVWKENEPEPPLPTVHEYSLMFDANGGIGAPGTMTYSGVEKTYGFVIPDSSISREGYTFLGWADSRGASEVNYLVGASVVLNSSSPSKTLYAVWLKNEEPIEPTIYIYTLAFNANGGDGIMETLNFSSTESIYEIALPTTIPKRKGYRFLKWVDSLTEPSSKSYLPGEVITLSFERPVLTLYAVWEKVEPGDPEEPEDPGETEEPEDPGDPEEPEDPGETEEPEKPVVRPGHEEPDVPDAGINSKTSGMSESNVALVVAEIGIASVTMGFSFRSRWFRCFRRGKEY